MPQCIVNMKAQPEYTNSGKVSMCMLAMSIIYDEAKADKKLLEYLKIIIKLINMLVRGRSLRILRNYHREF